MFHDVAVTWIWGFFFDEKSTGNFNLTHEGNIVSILAKYGLQWFGHYLSVVFDFCIHVGFGKIDVKLALILL